ncbi:MAG: aldehyde-activating protein [Desulfuromonas sp.]|nr:MAG: aldehyde-activating protein [Desulfuromonas sp.]
MSEAGNYRGSCFCGDVEFTLSGVPAAMAYCHCRSCREWSAGPVNAFTLWPPESFTITRGAEKISEFDRVAAAGDGVGTSIRKWCSNCGGHVYIDHPTMGVVDVPAVLIQGFSFQPGFHVHYQEKVHPMKDGLTKFKDLPAEAGGSGEELPE